MRTRRRVLVVGSIAAVVLAVAGVIVTLGGEGGSGAGYGLADESGFAGPGAPLGDGLVVPEGARLAGSLFAAGEQWPAGASFDWLAVLQVTGHPLDVWDDLMRQLREQGMLVPTSTTACRWLDGGPLLGRGAPDGAHGVSCEARGRVDRRASGGGLNASVVLWSHAEGGHVGLEVGTGPRPGTLGFVTSVPPPTLPLAEIDHDTTPLPGDPLDVVDADEPFPNPYGCFLREGRLRLPPGTRLITGTEDPIAHPDALAVLAADDAEDALRHLADEMAGRPEQLRGPEPPTVERRTTDDGEEFWVLEDTDESSGHCSLRSSPDNRAILLEKLWRD